MTSPIHVALIGAGGYGQNHLKALEEYDEKGLLRFVAVADPTAQKLMPEKSRVEARGVRWFDDYRTMFAGSKLDAVVISTPIPLHLPMLEAALDRNLAVLLEKPPVPLIQDFLRVNARPEAARVALGFKLIADPKLWRLKRAIQEGSLGAIRHISGSACWPRLDSYYARAGWAGRMTWNDMAVLDGPVTNALAHILHNMMFLAGEKPEGFAVAKSVRAELYRARPIESYDLCCLAGDWASGITFSAAFTHAAERRIQWSIEVEGDRGTARLGPDTLVFETQSSIPGGEAPAGDLFRDSWMDFYRMAIGGQAKPLTSFGDCLAYVAATNAMFVSSGRIHSLPPSVVRRYEVGEDGGFDVPGIASLIEETARTGRLFSEQGIPWAVGGSTVDIGGLNHFSACDFVRGKSMASTPGT